METLVLNSYSIKDTDSNKTKSVKTKGFKTKSVKTECIANASGYLILDKYCISDI